MIFFMAVLEDESGQWCVTHDNWELLLAQHLHPGLANPSLGHDSVVPDVGGDGLEVTLLHVGDGVHGRQLPDDRVRLLECQGTGVDVDHVLQVQLASLLQCSGCDESGQ